MDKHSTITVNDITIRVTHRDGYDRADNVERATGVRPSQRELGGSSHVPPMIYYSWEQCGKRHGARGIQDGLLSVYVGDDCGCYEDAWWHDVPSIEAAVSRVAQYYAPHDLGSLDPLDVGFDPRAQKMPVAVPDGGNITVRLPRSKRYPEGRVVTGTRHHVAHELRMVGFGVSYQ